MGMIVLGLRNLLRNKLRLALVVMLIGIPFFLLLVTRSIGDAVERQTAVLRRDVNTLLQLRGRGSMGHINMIGQDRLLPGDVLEKVRGIDHVLDTEPYLLAMSPITEPNFVMIVGLAPDAQKRLESHGEAGSPRILAGRDFTPADRGQPVGFIGQGYAEWAGITPGEIEAGTATLKIDPTRSHPAIFPMDLPPRELRIIGMYASGYTFGDLQLFVPMETFREMYQVDHGYSWVFVRVDDAENVTAVAERLEEVVGDVADIQAPKGAAAFTATTSRTITRLTGAGGLLAVALMVIVVFFVMLMQVRERAREIGTLKAIGAGNGRVTAQFITEATALSVLGGLVGVIFFWLLGEAMTGRVFALGIGPFLPSHYRPLLESLSVSSQTSLSALGVVLLVAVVAATLGSAYGVWQVIRLSPLEAMKHD